MVEGVGPFEILFPFNLLEEESLCTGGIATFELNDFCGVQSFRIRQFNWLLRIRHLLHFPCCIALLLPLGHFYLIAHQLLNFLQGLSFARF